MKNFCIFVRKIIIILTRRTFFFSGKRKTPWLMVIEFYLWNSLWKRVRSRLLVNFCCWAEVGGEVMTSAAEVISVFVTSLDLKIWGWCFETLLAIVGIFESQPPRIEVWEESIEGGAGDVFAVEGLCMEMVWVAFEAIEAEGWLPTSFLPRALINWDAFTVDTEPLVRKSCENSRKI